MTKQPAWLCSHFLLKPRKRKRHTFFYLIICADRELVRFVSCAKCLEEKLGIIPEKLLGHTPLKNPRSHSPLDLSTSEQPHRPARGSEAATPERGVGAIAERVVYPVGKSIPGLQNLCQFPYRQVKR